MAIAVIGMLDEREQALKLIKEQIEQRGHKPLLIDISVGNGAIIPSLKADITCQELARIAAPEGSLKDSTESATSIMAEGLRVQLSLLVESGELEGLIAITGMTGALITLAAMSAVPFGVPKLLISGATGQPAHAAKFAGYFALKDITVMNTVVDTVGMNSLVRSLAINGVNAVCGMVEGRSAISGEEKPSIAITEYGFCDRGAQYLREVLEGEYDMVSFHATGIGDKPVLELVPRGHFAGFIDLVPGAFSDHLLGGNRAVVGPGRLDVAARLALPYVFCPGGFDLIACGPAERKDSNDPLWTSRNLAARKLYLQDSTRVQARTNAEEMAYVATEAAKRLNQYENKGRVKAVIPLRGFSSLSVPGEPLHDPDADRAFVNALKKHLDPAIEIIEVDSDINSPTFAKAAADALLQVIRRTGAGGGKSQHA